ncbi:MAG: aminotransferase class IV [Alphaproteobacteria bacterium]|nr:aminotransferase class IV [Alphaproteobacteria bacterium]
MTESSNAAARDHALGIAYLDGRYLPAAEATVSVFDHSFLYGDGAFESIVFRHRRFYAFEAHYNRLVDSCRYIKLELPESHNSLLRIANELVAKNNADSGYLRIVVSRGEGYPLSDPRKAFAPSIVMTMQSQPPNRKAGDGLRLIVASTRRTSPDALDPRAKLNNYGNHIVAKLEAIGAGVDDAIMLDRDAKVAELPGCNIFVVSRGIVTTPPAGNILMGITRATAINLLRCGDIRGVLEVRQAHLTPLDLYAADEVFVTGTGTGIAFVSEIDGRRIGDGKAGPIVAQLIPAYDLVVDRCDNYFAGADA